VVLEREERLRRQVDVARTSMYVTAKDSVTTAYRVQEEGRADLLLRVEGATLDDVVAVLEEENSIAHDTFAEIACQPASNGGPGAPSGVPEDASVGGAAALSTRTKRRRRHMRQIKTAGTVLPDVIANVLAAVTVKVGGEMAHTGANRLVVSKVCRQVMKVANMRDVDIMMYEPHVIESYFACRNYQMSAGAYRRKVPRWLLKLLGFDDPRADRA